jgi:hypothetical protein
MSTELTIEQRLTHVETTLADVQRRLGNIPATNSPQLGSKPQRSKEELCQLAEDVFNRQIRDKLTHEDPDKFLAIDVNSGEFEVDSNGLAAIMRLRERLPHPEVWLRRVGSPYACCV